MNLFLYLLIPIYCLVPARRGLQQTARAATRHGARDPLVRPQVDQTYSWDKSRIKAGEVLLN